jgi:hypothetical protein
MTFLILFGMFFLVLLVAIIAIAFGCFLMDNEHWVLGTLWFIMLAAAALALLVDGIRKLAS